MLIAVLYARIYRYLIIVYLCVSSRSFTFKWALKIPTDHCTSLLYYSIYDLHNYNDILKNLLVRYLFNINLADRLGLAANHPDG